MSRILSIAFLVLFTAVAISGCSSAKKAILPVHDETLIFDRALDYTYLRVMDAVLNTPDWTLFETEKKEGRITAFNEKYPDIFAPIDQRMVHFRLERLARSKTSVRVTPSSQSVVGVADLMKEIKGNMNRSTA